MEFSIDLPKLWEMTQSYVLDFGLKFIAALAIFLIGRWIAKAITSMVRRTMNAADTDQTLVRFLGSMLYAILLTLVILAAIGQLGIKTSGFVAILGAAGLAIGLALQGSLSNFAAGVLIILFRPYRVGDFIEAAGVSGSIEAVQIFTTVLKTGDNKQVIIPNAEVMAGVITNYSAHETRRIDMVFGCGYDDDLAEVKAVLQGILDEDERILAEPAPTIGLMELADSSVNFAVRPWVKTADYWGVYFDVNEQVKVRFDAAGLSIPYPQSDVHLYQHSG